MEFLKKEASMKRALIGQPIPRIKDDQATVKPRITEMNAQWVINEFTCFLIIGVLLFPTPTKPVESSNWA